MARLALTVAGAVIGFMIGGPFGAQIGMMIGGMVGNLLFAPTIKGPRLSDLNVTASTYGQVIPELYGTMRIGGNMIWTSGLKEKRHKKSGKGGPKQITYTYSADFAIAFCKGPVDKLLRVWADGKLIINQNANTTGNVFSFILGGNTKTKYNVRFYSGDENQLPDSIMEAKLGVGNVPAYRGMCYLMFDNMQLEDFGNRIPQITAELTKTPIATNPNVPLVPNPNLPAPAESASGVDWDNQRCYRLDNTNQYFIHYDLITMKEVLRVPRSPHPFGTGSWGDTNAQFSIGGDYFYDQIGGAGNGSVIGIWNAKTGAFIDYYGVDSSGFGEDPGTFHLGDYDPHLANCGGRGQVVPFRVLGSKAQEDYWLHQGNIAGSFIIMKGTQWVYFTGTGKYFTVQYNWLRGKEIGGTAETIGNSQLHGIINNNAATIKLRTLTVYNGASGMTKAIGNGYFNYINAAVSDIEVDLATPFAGENFNVRNYAYDKSDNGLVFWWDHAGAWRFGKYLVDEKQWKWKWKDTDYSADYRLNTGNGAYPTSPPNSSNLNGGHVGWINSWNGGGNDAHLWRADLSSGRLIEVPPTAPGGTTLWDSFRVTSFDSNSDSILGVHNRIFWNTANAGVTVKAIIDDVLNRTGVLSPLDYDTSALASTSCIGYMISRETGARDVLNQLASAYFFDGVESDYKIKIKLRGSGAVGDITQKHLGFVKDRDTSITETRTQEMEIPMRITVTHADQARDYQVGTQSAKRNTDPYPSTHSHVEQRFELPIAMDASTAKQIADKALKMAWNSRTSYKLKLPWEFLKYEPSDVITVSMTNGTVYNMRLHKMDMGVDFTLDAMGVANQSASYVSNLTADNGLGFVTQVVKGGFASDLYVLNTPLLRDTDDTQGTGSIYYVTSSAKSPGNFSNTYLYKSLDGVDYTDLDLLSHDIHHGTVKEALPKRFGYGLDTKTTLTVTMPDAAETLSSITFDQLTAGGNAALIGNEVIQYQTAVLNADGTYTLSNILRARRGTNYAAVSHTAGERFLVLDPTMLLKEVNAPSLWSTTQYFKAVPQGGYAENTQGISIDMAPNDLRPYTPETVTCNDDGTNVTIGFQRRSRITAELADGSPDIIYREGQGATAHFSYSVWAGKGLADTPWVAPAQTPTFTGTVPIYSGTNFATLQFQFAMAGITKFVVQIAEEGFVTGFPKIIQFDRIHANDWDRNELY